MRFRQRRYGLIGVLVEPPRPFTTSLREYNPLEASPRTIQRWERSDLYTLRIRPVARPEAGSEDDLERAFMDLERNGAHIRVPTERLVARRSLIPAYDRTIRYGSVIAVRYTQDPVGSLISGLNIIAV